MILELPTENPVKSPTRLMSSSQGVVGGEGEEVDFSSVNITCELGLRAQTHVLSR